MIEGNDIICLAPNATIPTDHERPWMGEWITVDRLASGERSLYMSAIRIPAQGAGVEPCTCLDDWKRGRRLENSVFKHDNPDGLAICDSCVALTSDLGLVQSACLESARLSHLMLELIDKGVLVGSVYESLEFEDAWDVYASVVGQPPRTERDSTNTFYFHAHALSVVAGKRRHLDRLGLGALWRKELWEAINKKTRWLELRRRAVAWEPVSLSSGETIEVSRDTKISLVSALFGVTPLMVGVTPAYIEGEENSNFSYYHGDAVFRHGGAVVYVADGNYLIVTPTVWENFCLRVAQHYIQAKKKDKNGITGVFYSGEVLFHWRIDVRPVLDYRDEHQRSDAADRRGFQERLYVRASDKPNWRPDQLQRHLCHLFQCSDPAMLGINPIFFRGFGEYCPRGDMLASEWPRIED